MVPTSKFSKKEATSNNENLLPNSFTEKFPKSFQINTKLGHHYCDITHIIYTT